MYNYFRVKSTSFTLLIFIVSVYFQLLLERGYKIKRNICSFKNWLRIDNKYN